MMNRVLFKNILGITAFWIPVKALARLTKQNMILPFYHAVSDEDLPHLKYSYDIKTISQFMKDLDFLLKSYNPVDFSDLKDYVKNVRKLKKPVMALSFDDGLKEVHDVIAPLLFQKGIPATLFINPEFVDNKSLFYKYKANLVINRLDRAGHPRNLYEIINSRLGTDIRKKSHMIRTILNIGYERQDILDAIAELVDLDFSTFLKIRKPYMTVEHITRLQEQGFRIGSHSLDHPLYSVLSLEEQLKQTKKSLEWITCSRHGVWYSRNEKDSSSISFPENTGGRFRIKCAFFHQGRIYILYVERNCRKECQEGLKEHGRKGRKERGKERRREGGKEGKIITQMFGLQHMNLIVEGF